MKRVFAINLVMVLAMLTPLSVWSQKDYAVVKDGTITFYYDDNISSRDGKIYDVTKELKNSYPSWLYDNFNTVVFDDSFSNYKPTKTAWWFNDCSSLTEVKNLSNLNLSAATDMSYMFCKCSGLKKIDLSGLSTANVKNMAWMFYRCSALEDINLQGINTENVENMYQMFSQCNSLKQLDLSSFNTSKVENMGKMFFNCQNLQSVYVGDGWTTLYVGNSSDMFLGCTKLVGGNGTICDGFGISNPIDATFARADTDSKPGYFTYKAPSVATPYAIVDDGTLTFYYDGNKETRKGQVFDIADEYAGGGNFPAWRSTDITKVVFDSSFSNYLPFSTARWFHSCSNLEEISGLANLNTSHVMNMGSMFYGCHSLKRLDLSSFNTSSVTNMSTMFYECSSLETLDLISFETGNVTAMTAMFYGCTGLKQLNVNSFDTSNVEDMQYMFFCCGNLTSLNVTNFNTSKVTNMERMFSCEEGLQCLGKLTSLDLSSFSTAKVTNMERMFQDNIVLSKIYASEKWSTESVNSGDYMFFGCMKLVGGAGSICNGIMQTNHTYARIDTPDVPGYFTDKASSGIDGIILNRENERNHCFMLDGTHHSTPQKGINIINGKKIILK